MDVIEFIPAQLAIWGNNFVRNASGMWNDMTAKTYIRLIVIIGAYALIRPYVMKFGEKLQAKQHEKELDPYEMATADEKKKAKLSPNNLRGIGGKQVSFEESDSEGEEATGTDVKWGKKARKRQRQVIKKVLEDEERIRRELQEDDEDKDIQEFLVDDQPLPKGYKKGSLEDLDDWKDGWDK